MIKPLNFTTLSFIAKYWVALPNDPELKDDGLLPGERLAINATNRNELRVETVTKPTDFSDAEAFICRPFNLFISDGLDQIEIAAISNTYILGKAAKHLSQTKWQKSSLSVLACDLIFARHPPVGMRHIAVEKIAEESVDVYERTLDVSGETLIQRLYIAQSTELPIRMSRFAYSQGSIGSEVLRTDYSEWIVDASLEPSLFNTIPPVGMKPRV